MADSGQPGCTGEQRLLRCVTLCFGRLPAIGSDLLFCRNDINGWNNRFQIYRSVVIRTYPCCGPLRSRLDRPRSARGLLASVLPCRNLLDRGSAEELRAEAREHPVTGGECSAIRGEAQGIDGARMRNVATSWPVAVFHNLIQPS